MPSVNCEKADWVYPRVGGGNAGLSCQDARLGGLSPRGRGKHVAGRAVVNFRRSIPAWAGETQFTQTPDMLYKVYPRVGGGNLPQRRAVSIRIGLSPRGRGKHTEQVFDKPRRRSIPAWAGETVHYRRQAQRIRVYPRVGGGNVDVLSPVCSHEGLSPRGRGKRGNAACSRQRLRSIPAWAGETICTIPPNAPPTVYPRVGGGNPHSLHWQSIAEGLSPRGRGKQRNGGGVPAL